MRLWLVWPMAALVLLVLPLLAGVLSTLLPAFGLLPALGAEQLSLDPWRALWAAPGLTSALTATLISTGLSTLLALFWALLLLAYAWQSRALLGLQRALASVLSVPHAAFAIGVILLFAPSGWLVRLLSPWLTGWDAPPLVSWIGDPYGLSLAWVLTLKEMPFLLFMSMAALSRLPVAASLRLGRTLGYSDSRIWGLLIIPQLLPMLRLPVLAVLAYGVSVVDLALIAGPSAPPTLAVMIDRWFMHPDLWLRLQASSGALLLLLLMLALMAGWLLIEALLARFCRFGASRGRRQSYAPFLPVILRTSAWGLLLLTLGVLLVLLLWSFTHRWSFADPWPSRFSLLHWQAALSYLPTPAWHSAWLAATSSALALVLVVACLEAEQQLPRQARWFRPLLQLLYLPLLLPQVAFLFGIQWLLVRLDADAKAWSVLWAHMLFVVPYVYLSLSGPYRAFDGRYYQQAVLLSGRPWRALIWVKWPMLLRSLCYVFAIGFSVSIAQYLSTRYVGAGRFATLTTETVALATGGDRRPLAAYALVQWALPAVVFAFMLLLPWLRFRRRPLMQPSQQ